MDIGRKIKESRIRLDLTQEELADRCEVTKSYISQLENDKMSPSIDTLEYLLEALGTNLSDFFHEEAPEKVVFREADENVKGYDGYAVTWLVPTAQKLAMEAIRVSLSANASTALDAPHEGEEYGYVLKGTIEVWNGTTSSLCTRGESFYLMPRKNHWIKNHLKTEALVLWVSCPPSF